MTSPDSLDLADLPEHAVTAVRRFEDGVSEVTTRAERLGQLPLPDPEETRVAPVDQQDQAQLLRTAAESASAPLELIRLGRAVRAGETTYEAIVSGAADHLRVVAEARAAARKRFDDLVANGAIRLVLDHDDAGETGKPAPEPDDEQPDTFMKPVTAKSWRR